MPRQLPLSVNIHQSSFSLRHRGQVISAAWLEYVVVEVAVPRQNLVFPFATEDKSRENDFSEKMEYASLLCLAEAERKKKSGFLGGTVETLSFLSKLHYPLWAIPRKNTCVLIDGMETVSNNIPYLEPPDVEAFTEQIERNRKVREMYQSTLNSNREIFAKFTAQTEIPVEGVIIDKELLSDTWSFIQEALGKNGVQVESASLIPPVTGEEEALNIGKKVFALHDKLKLEMKSLQFAAEMLEKETERHVGKFQKEMEQTRGKFDAEICEERAKVAVRKEEYERDLKRRIGEIEAANKEEVNVRLVEKKKWERTLARLVQNEREYEKRRELRKQRKDEIGEIRWRTRLQDVKSQISTVRRKIKMLSDFINRSNRETAKTTKKLQRACRKLVDEEEKKITDLQNALDTAIDTLKNEMEDMQQSTSNTVDKIEHLLEQKKERYSALEEATIPCKSSVATLIYVPFYLAKYKAGKKGDRYRFHPPVIARRNEGLKMKIRKAFRSFSLQSKIGNLLNSRSKALEKMLALFNERTRDEKHVKKTLNQLGASCNLLASEGFKAKVRKGLEELEEEGWIKPEEREAMLQIYASN